jgi:hypothetical protein
MEAVPHHNQLSNPMLNILKRLFKIISLIQKVQKSIIHLPHKKTGPIAEAGLILPMLSLHHGSGEAWS